MSSNLDKRWSVIMCPQKESCWCRVIVVEGMEDSNDMEHCIVPAGSINKETAEHIVGLHNADLLRHDLMCLGWAE